jgi:hypothetical protein
MLVDLSADTDCDVLINSDPQAAEVYTVTIDTATDSEDYGINLTDPLDVSLSINSGTGSSTSSVASALADEWNTTPQARAMGEAVAASAVVTITGVFPGVPFTIEEDENAAKMTLANPTDAAEADTVPFGRAMISTSYQTGEPDQLGVLAKSSSLTAQADQYTLTYDAGVEISAVIEIDGETYESVPFAMATNLATVTAALDAAIDAAVPANSVVATSDGTSVTITSELAGKPFKSWIRFGVGATTAAAVKSSNSSTPSTDFNAVFAGISLWTYDEQQAAINTEAAEYAANAGVEVARRGGVWVESTEAITARADVYVELDGTGSDAGKFYTSSSATRVRVDPSLLRWSRADSSSSDADVAALRIDLAA